MTDRRFVLFFPLLLLAGCMSPAIPQSATVPPPPAAAAVARGIDLPTDAAAVAAQIKNRGVGFVARYYRRAGSRWRSLQAAEAKALSGRGLDIVTVWESFGRNPAYFSYGAGFADAIDAYRQAQALGQPAGSAIYFAVDYDASTHDIIGRVNPYFRGIAAGFLVAGEGEPQYRVGVYGSGAVCEAIKTSGLAQFAWLSMSPGWSGSRVYADWDIKQGKKLPGLAFNHDSDEAKADYGGFQLEGAM